VVFGLAKSIWMRLLVNSLGSLTFVRLANPVVVTRAESMHVKIITAMCNKCPSISLAFTMNLQVRPM
jgi:hypothetical protein